MVDWTPDPTRTEPAADGSGRRREWAFRDVSPGAPRPQRKPAAQVPVADDDVVLEPADGGYTSLGREAMRASVEAGVQTRNAIRQSATWKLYAPWIGMVLFLGVALYGYGQPRGWFGAVEYPQTQPNVKVEHSTRSVSGGTNHSRDLLIEWSRSVTWKRLRADEQEAARRAVEADR